MCIHFHHKYKCAQWNISALKLVAKCVKTDIKWIQWCIQVMKLYLFNPEVNTPVNYEVRGLNSDVLFLIVKNDLQWIFLKKITFSLHLMLNSLPLKAVLMHINTCGGQFVTCASVSWVEAISREILCLLAGISMDSCCAHLVQQL